MGLVEAIFFRQIGGAKDTFLQSHPYHISDDDIAKGIVKFMVDVYDETGETVALATILTMVKKIDQSK